MDWNPSGSGEVGDAEEAAVVCPHLLDTPAARGGEGGELVLVVLVRGLGPDALAAFERDVEAGDADGLGNEADQVHLHAGEDGVIEGVVPEAIQVEVRPELAVQTPQD